jgi:hypothetical protein
MHTKNVSVWMHDHVFYESSQAAERRMMYYIK